MAASDGPDAWRIHVEHMIVHIENVIEHARAHVTRSMDPAARVLFEAAAEVLAGLASVFKAYLVRVEKEGFGKN